MEGVERSWWLGSATTYLQQNRKYINTALLNVSYNAVLQNNSIPQGVQSSYSPNMAPCNCILCSLNLQRLKIRWNGNDWTQDTIAVTVHPQFQFERYFNTGRNCILRVYSMNELTLEGINPLKYSSYQMHHLLKHLKKINFFPIFIMFFLII